MAANATSWESIPNTIMVVFDGINKTAGEMATRLVVHGESLTLTLSALLISWNMLLIMLDGEDILGTVKQLFKTIFVCSVVMMCITSYDTFFNKIIPDSFAAITKKVTGGEGVGIDPRNGIIEVATPAVAVIKALATLDNTAADKLLDRVVDSEITRKELEKSIDKDDKGFLGGLEKRFDEWKATIERNLDIAAFTMHQLGKVLVIAFRLFAGLIVGVSMILTVAIMVVGLIKKAIAIALGPIFIPWILFEPASFLFSGWLRFYLGSLVYLLVALVMLKIMEVIPVSLNKYIAVVSSTEYMYALAVELVGIFVVTLMYILMTYIMWQVPSIASGLTGGTNISLGNLLKKNPLMGALPGAKVPSLKAKPK